jgi:hypothetical protein
MTAMLEGKDWMVCPKVISPNQGKIRNQAVIIGGWEASRGHRKDMGQMVAIRTIGDKPSFQLEEWVG